jgi:hypothetical protein
MNNQAAAIDTNAIAIGRHAGEDVHDVGAVCHADAGGAALDRAEHDPELLVELGLVGKVGSEPVRNFVCEA